MDRVVLLDGYDDEPAGLGGVPPPYLDVYARYVAGAIWSVDPSIDVRYITVDEARRDWNAFADLVSGSKLLVVMAGIVTPGGKYLGGGEPITLRELIRVGGLGGFPRYLEAPWPGLDLGGPAVDP